MRNLLLAAVAALALAGCATAPLSVSNVADTKCELGMSTPNDVLLEQQKKSPELDLKIVNVIHAKDGKTDYVVIAVTSEAKIKEGYTLVLALTVKQGCVVDQKFMSAEDAAALA